MYCGHIITTTCLHQGMERFNITLSYPIFLFGALFPDLIDKSLAFAACLPSRSVCHSVVVLTAFFLALICALPKKRTAIYTFFAGTILHLIQDIPIEINTFLWPFHGPFKHAYAPDFLERLWQYYVELNKPIPWTIEMICLPWFMVILINHKRKLIGIPFDIFARLRALSFSLFLSVRQK